MYVLMTGGGFSLEAGPAKQKPAAYNWRPSAIAQIYMLTENINKYDVGV